MSETMEKGSGKVRKIFKYFSVSAVTLLAVLFAADTVWVNSGSNEWKLALERDGIRVYSLKTPGYRRLKYKLQMHVDARLSDVTFYLTDLNTGYDLGVTDIRRLEEVTTPQISYSYDTYKVPLPPPFDKRETVILNSRVQDPVTKTVRISIYASPNKLPVDPNITRIIRLSNNWTLTPVATGGVDIESLSEVDFEVPDLLQNLVMPEILVTELSKMPRLIKTKRYRNNTVPYITELNENPAPAQAPADGQQVNEVS